MLQEIKKIALNKQPIKVCKTSDELSTEMQKFNDDKIQGKKICFFIGERFGQSWLMFTTEEGYNSLSDNDTQVRDLAENDAVAFEAPCPPFCEKGGNGNLYIETP